MSETYSFYKGYDFGKAEAYKEILSLLESYEASRVIENLKDKLGIPCPIDRSEKQS